MTEICPICDRSFANETGVEIHKTKKHKNNRKYRREGFLRKKYLEEKLSAAAIADEIGVSESTIHNYLIEFGIETRSKSDYRKQHANYRTNFKGYPIWEDSVEYEGSSGTIVKVHRLLAVAEYGFEPVCGMHVHHRNGLQWDNRPGNIELLSPQDHARVHAESRWESAERGWS